MRRLKGIIPAAFASRYRRWRQLDEQNAASRRPGAKTRPQGHIWRQLARRSARHSRNRRALLVGSSVSDAIAAPVPVTAPRNAARPFIADPSHSQTRRLRIFPSTPNRSTGVISGKGQLRSAHLRIRRISAMPKRIKCSRRSATPCTLAVKGAHTFALGPPALGRNAQSPPQALILLRLCLRKTRRTRPFGWAEVARRLIRVQTPFIPGSANQSFNAE